MRFHEAVKTCFRRYVTFSGRASRPEYWYFFLFVFLGSIAAGILDAALFGSGNFESYGGPDGYGFRASSDGPLAALFTVGTLLPWLAAGWRRMHDTGRSGLFLFYPFVVVIGIGIFARIAGVFGQAVPGPAEQIFDGAVGIVIVFAAIVFIISPLLVLWWLTRPSQPGPNKYGPNPHEVSP